MDYDDGSIIFSQRDQDLAGTPERICFDDHIFADALDAFDSVSDARLMIQGNLNEFELDTGDYELSPTERAQYIRLQKECLHVQLLWEKLGSLVAPQLIEEELASIPSRNAPRDT